VRVGEGRTFENWSNLLDGDRDVVMTILGSYVPTLAYSSSTWFFGSSNTLASYYNEWMKLDPEGCSYPGLDR
jgi:hypothetical protein